MAATAVPGKATAKAPTDASRRPEAATGLPGFFPRGNSVSILSGMASARRGSRIVVRSLGGAVIAIWIVAAPSVYLDDGWAPAAHWPNAVAKGGGGGSGSDGSDSGGSGSGSGDSGGSGSGSGGSGSGGSGSSGDDGHDDGHDDGGDDDTSDHSGHGQGGRNGDAAGGDGSGSGADRVASDVQVSFHDGSLVEVWDGVFEMREANGDVVTHHDATPQDYAFVEFQSRSQIGTFTIRSVEALRLEVSAKALSVIFADDQAMSIEDGLLRLVNAAGETVLSRPATDKDRERLQDTARTLHPGVVGARLEEGVDSFALERDVISVRYSNRVVEQLVGDRLELRDQLGNVIVERATTAEDRPRLESLLTH